MRELYTLEPYDIEELKRKPVRRSSKGTEQSNASKILEQFAESSMDCCLIYKHKDPINVHWHCTSVRKSIDRLKLKNTVRAVQRGTELFLVKKSKW